MLSNQSLALLMLGFPMGMGMVPELHPDVQGARKNFQMTNLTMPNNISSMKYSLNSVPGLADVGVPHGVEDGPRTPAPGSGSKIPAYHVDQRKKLKEWNG